MVVFTAARNRSRCLKENPEGLSERSAAPLDIDRQALSFDTKCSAD